MLLPDEGSTGGKVKILIAVINFRNLTGAEMYVYELSRELVKMGHDVSVLSNIGGEIAERAIKNGVKVYSFQNPPREKFDILHLNEIDPARGALRLYPNTPAIMTIHSEYECETPLLDREIHRYVCIRPSIQEHIVQEHGVKKEDTTIIYNPVDFSRFNTKNKKTKKDLVVFPGTIDDLRKDTLLDLNNRFGKNLRVVGLNVHHFMDGSDAELVDQTWDVENHIKEAEMTAGILLGRTTIESWLCGVKTEIYDVDLTGSIKSCRVATPPTDLEKFDSRLVAKQLEEQYAIILTKHRHNS